MTVSATWLGEVMGIERLPVALEPSARRSQAGTTSQIFSLIFLKWFSYLLKFFQQGGPWLRCIWFWANIRIKCGQCLENTCWCVSFEQHQSALPHPAAHQFALPANLEGDQGGKSPRRSQFQILTTLKEELHHLLFSNWKSLWEIWKEKQTLFFQ